MGMPASLRARIAAAVLRLIGWRLAYAPPPGPKAVVVVYPHTSNWDFPIGVIGRAALDLPLRYVAKHTLFRWPFGMLFRGLGGIAVDRRVSTGLVEQLRARFDAHDTFYLAITPEGTRSRTEYWKSGFYQIARAARVPVGLGFIDYGGRRVGIDTWLELSGDADADMARIAAFYADKRGFHPEKAGPVRFRADSLT
ncbi:MAG TPA: lysophospholipid acyltransferase family protein [Rhodocyclaceae bacterium]|nr:lysophospholipid acyltransferase family protein [Rhodocyclaceae bacterium]HNA05184.1 lysophospholipid acyltransferase family protein [Rhodocyclaceae bacterium]HNB79569.1 lysophospholipid acyltransferase family protein [Rhodocyclaceae bacterium]HNH99538.1 lysophospholipid acyltransferase family protein [Rhodocyclaceae bacterium]